MSPLPDRDVLNVLILMDFSDVTLDRLQSVSPRLKLTRLVVDDPSEVPPQLWDTADILYTYNVIPGPESVPRLRWVQHHLAGPNNLLASPLMASRELLVTTTSGLNTRSIAEHAFTMLMAMARNVPEWVRRQQESHWPEDRFTIFPPRDLCGALLGIIGYGKIGREVAQMGHAFGMEVIATRRHLTASAAPDPFVGRFYPAEATRTLAGQCDYLVVAVPLTAETRHLVDRSLLEAMKPTAFLINVARGAVVDELALIEALTERRIAGAALDVFEQEPLPDSSPLWRLDNVLITPHIAGNTQRYHERAAEIFAQNLERYLDGRPLLNQVAVERGY